jgi:hypothetical protein
MENIQEAMADRLEGSSNGGANLNLEVADPSKTSAARHRPEPATTAGSQHS